VLKYRRRSGTTGRAQITYCTRKNEWVTLPSEHGHYRNRSAPSGFRLVLVSGFQKRPVIPRSVIGASITMYFPGHIHTSQYGIKLLRMDDNVRALPEIEPDREVITPGD